MTAEPAIDARRFRDTIGRFATGVTVLTWDDGEHVRGMTANAVTSVSLDPMLLLACVDKRGSAHEQLMRAQAFTVNILAEDQISVSQALSSGSLCVSASRMPSVISLTEASRERRSWKRTL